MAIDTDDELRGLGGNDQDTRSKKEKETAALVHCIEAGMDDGSRYLEMMYCAYLRETQIPARNVALVVKEKEGLTTYQFVGIKKANELMNEVKYWHNKDSAQ